MRRVEENEQKIEHSDTNVSRHFNSEGHSTEDMVVPGLLFAEKDSRKRKTLEKRIIFKLGTLIPQGLNKRFSFISQLLHLSSAIRFSFSNLTLYLLRRILASHSLLHSINTLFYQSFFLCFFSLIVLLLATTDEGSSPKRLVIQALGYIIYLMKFMC